MKFINSFLSIGGRIYLQLDSESDIQPLGRDQLPLKEVIAGYRELKRVNEGQLHREDIET